ncbi:DMT family transporter [Pseudohongiella spirulinae]|nr:SMR family transporter [Pseudohongiella spirulinae]
MMSKYSIVLMHAFLLASLLAFSHGILKWVSVQAHDDYWQLMLTQWKGVLAALAIYGFIFFYYILVLRSSPVSILYPVYTGLSVLFVLVAGRLVFQEPVGIPQVAGAVCILAGIVLMGGGR